jgi:hypothetical protein
MAKTITRMSTIEMFAIVGFALVEFQNFEAQWAKDETWAADDKRHLQRHIHDLDLCMKELNRRCRDEKATTLSTSLVPSK